MRASEQIDAATAILDGEPDTLDHIVCPREPDLALCGLDVGHHVMLSKDAVLPNPCAVCSDLDPQPCPRCGR